VDKYASFEKAGVLSLISFYSLGHDPAGSLSVKRRPFNSHYFQPNPSCLTLSLNIFAAMWQSLVDNILGCRFLWPWVHFLALPLAYLEELLTEM